ncbi:hypothetical protein R3W88_015893 [Solanum pinnatisectum]|uniref:DUF4283 domain-containing protein n=1 Tax=Solanum pinnatisectum TaxID=50273 RepID=A0AAV9KY55_9SOLN|nr:hypothetical protein R3W88_015893 [Solanum pinnatisectum]
MQNALHEGPWFVIRSFLSVRCWEPIFVPNETMEYHTAIWTRLPQLPIEFYDRGILEKIGKKLGATIRGRYARICIQVPIGKPLQHEVQIGNHTQKVVYERDEIMCTSYGIIGHVQKNCAKHAITTKDITHNAEKLWTLHWRLGRSHLSPKR